MSVEETLVAVELELVAEAKTVVEFEVVACEPDFVIVGTEIAGEVESVRVEEESIVPSVTADCIIVSVIVDLPEIVMSDVAGGCTVVSGP